MLSILLQHAAGPSQMVDRIANLFLVDANGPQKGISNLLLLVDILESSQKGYPF